ncbi:hypothetical protein [Methanosarcina sp. 1.H.A.2.2]|uniref:hypothetical protein n=1 Tax=Methanosarcina sp. 1.H.A.2.2 TaxID=1483601 RepID=UPI00138DE9A0|nr:hypothetical protein [Methanosarcina sp. 1.H.A.2.2]
MNRVMVYSPSLGDPTNIKYSISSQKTRFSGIMGPKNEKIEKKKKTQGRTLDLRKKTES